MASLLRRRASAALTALIHACGYELKKVQTAGATPLPSGQELVLQYCVSGHKLMLDAQIDGRPVGEASIAPEALTRRLIALKHIALRRLLEYMPLPQIQTLLSTCNAALRLGGTLEISVPDLERILDDQPAGVSPEAEYDHWFERLFGYAPPSPATVQRPSPPHASWLAERHLRFLLEVAGFSRIVIEKEYRLLRALAVKSLNTFERQVTPHLETVRPDHVGRYRFAVGYLVAHDVVLDVACGIGYGAAIMISEGPGVDVIAMDIDAEAVRYGVEHYASPAIRYCVADAAMLSIKPGGIDVAVCFETIEHVQNDGEAVANLAKALRPGGRLICSVPNEIQMPYSKTRYPYHVRHYRPEDIRELLSLAGLVVEETWCQESEAREDVKMGSEGKFLLMVSRKPGHQSAR